MRTHALTGGFCAGAVALAAGAASGQLLTTQVVATGLTRPVFVTAPPGDTSRIFIVEQRGSGGVATQAYIKILDLATGAVNATPFLVVPGLATGSEQGLLGLAFDPNYATNGFFYVDYTSSGGGNTQVVRYHVSADPNVADPASATTVLTVVQPFSNHNAGWIAFGPDGYLYISLGDGGSEGDPQNNGQNLNTLLSKILRIDVSTLPYQIPPTNPFVGQPNVRPETFVWGLRNPWRDSFDRQTGDLWIGDVGQNAWEEIDFHGAMAPGGDNYGWRCYEANVPYNMSGSCPAMSAVHFPVWAYQHAAGLCSVTGGYVYRGCSIPALRGEYFFADYCTSRIWSFPATGMPVASVTERTAELQPPGGPSISGGLTSFGEDASGELYICAGSRVFKIVARCPANCDGSTSAPVLNVNDFLCFQNNFASGDCYANCDQSTTAPILNINDFICFSAQFATGCP